MYKAEIKKKNREHILAQYIRLNKMRYHNGVRLRAVHIIHPCTQISRDSWKIKYIINHTKKAI